MQCVAVCCSVLRSGAVTCMLYYNTSGSLLQCAAVCCSVCNALQCVAASCRMFLCSVCSVSPFQVQEALDGSSKWRAHMEQRSVTRTLHTATLYNGTIWSRRVLQVTHECQSLCHIMCEAASRCMCSSVYLLPGPCIIHAILHLETYCKIV